MTSRALWNRKNVKGTFNHYRFLIADCRFAELRRRWPFYKQAVADPKIKNQKSALKIILVFFFVSPTWTLKKHGFLIMHLHQSRIGFSITNRRTSFFAAKTYF